MVSAKGSSRPLGLMEPHLIDDLAYKKFKNQ